MRKRAKERANEGKRENEKEIVARETGREQWSDSKDADSVDDNGVRKLVGKNTSKRKKK